MATAVLEQPRTEPADGQQRPAVRGAIAVVVSRFPVITETFILREIIEMERQAQPVVLVPLIREYPSVIHPEVEPWVRRALYTLFVSWDIMAANLRALRRPVLYAALLAQTILGSARSLNVLIGRSRCSRNRSTSPIVSRTEGVQPRARPLRHPPHDDRVHHFASHWNQLQLHGSWHDVFVPWRRALMRTKIRARGSSEQSPK